MLPREIRVRLVIAFALMAVIPILGSIYFATVFLANISLSAYWAKIIIITSMILICAGFVIMLNCIWNIIDIAKTTDQFLSKPRHINQANDEILKFEHLLLYMEDQIYAAKRILNAKRKIEPNTNLFKLPTLIPSSLIKKRLLSLTKNAELNGIQLGVFAWKAENISQNETDDDTLIPKWLVTLLKDGLFIPDAIGRLTPGFWLGWADNKNVKQMNEYYKKMHESIYSNNLKNISVIAFSHPSEHSDLSFLINSNNILEID